MRYGLDIFTNEDAPERVFVRIDNVLYEVVDGRGGKVLRLYASENALGSWEIGGWTGSYPDLRKNITGE